MAGVAVSFLKMDAEDRDVGKRAVCPIVFRGIHFAAVGASGGVFALMLFLEIVYGGGKELPVGEPPGQEQGGKDALANYHG